MQHSKNRCPDRQQGQRSNFSDTLKDLIFRLLTEEFCQAPRGQREIKTPLRESAEVRALASLSLCCQRVMFTSNKHGFACSKPTARSHVQPAMLISTACSAKRPSKIAKQQAAGLRRLMLCQRLLAACFHAR